MTYGKMHRFFLRTVASQGVLSIIDAKAVLKRFNDDEQLPSVTDLVKAINDEIRPYYQEIKITKDEVTNEDVVVFLSLADDAATKAQNIFSSTELEYFRMLIEQIMSTESRQITGINAMNLVSSMKSNFTKTDAQKVLNTWCRMRYLDMEQENYALGVRAIHEFEGYFLQNMPHAVEECILCKQVVFRVYNCPGCGQTVHTKCLLRYLERVQKWPCCKIDFEQEQLEHLNTEGARLPPTLLDTTRESEENNTVAESTQAQESSELMDETQEVKPEISQRVSRKRKRQISIQVANTENSTLAEPARVLTARRSTNDNILEEPVQGLTSRRFIRTSTVTEPAEILTMTRSASNNTVTKPAQVLTARRSTKDSIVEEPAQVPTTRPPTRNSTVAEPTQVLTTRPTRNSTVAEPTQVLTTRPTRNSTVAEPTQVLTTRPTRNSTVAEPTQVLTTHPTRNSTVAEPTQVLTTRPTRNSTVAEPTQVLTTRPTRNSTVAEPTQVLTTRPTRNSTVTEPTQVLTTRRSTTDDIVVAPTQVPTTSHSKSNNRESTEIQESFEILDGTDEVVPAQEGQRTYARATKDIPARLAVAIGFSHPSWDLTKEEAEHVKTELENSVMATDPSKPLPAFRRSPQVAEGTVQMWCEDDYALTWLNQNVPKIRLPDTNLQLKVMKQADVPSRVRASLFVPRYRGDVARLHSILTRQNTWCDVSRWSLYKATTVGGDNSGTYLTLGLPPEEAEKVLGRERRISYLLGSIYVRFWPTTRPSDTQTDDTDGTTTLPTTAQTNDTDIDELEEVMARAAMADDVETIPPESGWSERLLASSPGERHEETYREEVVERLSNGSVSD